MAAEKKMFDEFLELSGLREFRVWVVGGCGWFVEMALRLRLESATINGQSIGSSQAKTRK